MRIDPFLSRLLPEFTDKQCYQVGRILREVFAGQSVTRGDLSLSLSLDVSSIAKYTKALVEAGVLREVTRNVDGRTGRQTELELDHAAALNMVVILDLHRITGALVDLSGEVVVQETAPMHFGIDASDLLDSIFGVLRRLKDHASQTNPNILGIAIGMGGAVDQNNGISYRFRYSQNWDSVELATMVEERFNLPCYLIHDTVAAVAGEKYFGYGRGVDNFITVWMADGVSLAMVINGEIYLGNNGFLGEFGHTQAVEEGTLCYCGHSGCLETATNSDYILRRATDGLRRGVDSELRASAGKDMDKLGIDAVKAAASRGDRLAKSIFEDVAFHLGNKLSDVINVINPGLVTFRGAVIDGNPFLFDNIERILLNRSMWNISNHIELRFADRDSAIRLKGLAGWVLANYVGAIRVGPRESLGKVVTL
ncbi:MAG: ROK family protein [Alkalispirochaeta sp.]